MPNTYYAKSSSKTLITIIKNKNHKLGGVLFNEIPILDMLLVKENSTDEKLYSELKKTKNIIIKIKK